MLHPPITGISTLLRLLFVLGFAFVDFSQDHLCITAAVFSTIHIHTVQRPFCLGGDDQLQLAHLVQQAHQHDRILHHALFTVVVSLPISTLPTHRIGQSLSFYK